MEETQTWRRGKRSKSIVSGRTYNWCKHHVAWTMHKPSECTLARQGQQQPTNNFNGSPMMKANQAELQSTMQNMMYNENYMLGSCLWASACKQFFLLIYAYCSQQPTVSLLISTMLELVWYYLGTFITTISNTVLHDEFREHKPVISRKRSKYKRTTEGAPSEYYHQLNCTGIRTHITCGVRKMREWYIRLRDHWYKLFVLPVNIEPVKTQYRRKYPKRKKSSRNFRMRHSTWLSYILLFPLTVCSERNRKRNSEDFSNYGVKPFLRCFAY